MPVLINPHGFPLQVAFGAAGAGAQDSSGTLSVPYPSGIVAGSFLVVHAATLSSVISDLAGWTEILGSEISTHRSWFKEAVGDESGSLSIAHLATGEVIGRMYRFSHGSLVEAASANLDEITNATVNAVNVTTLGPKRMAVQLVFAAANTTISAFTGESGADYTEAVAEFTDASLPGLLSCQVAGVNSPTAITGGTATLGASSNHKHGHGFAIAP